MAIDPKNSLFLIDGSSFLYRAYYGMGPLHTSKGLPVQAVYSFCRMIKKLIESFKPEHVVLVWDSKGKTARHELYEPYKATRQAPPSDLFEQKEKIVEFATLIGIAQVQQSGVEADDLMYSLAIEWAQSGGTVVMVTSDKDMGQLLSPAMSMFDAFKDILYTQEAFEQKMGFPVARLPFYFALLGDSSDNIPGVKGVGKKTALELVQQYDSLHDLYAKLDSVDNKRARTALEAHKNDAFLSHELFLLRRYPIQLEKTAMRFDPSLWSRALPLFQELEFKSLIKEISGSGSTLSLEQKIKELKKYQFITVTTQGQLDALCHELQEAKVYALDTETDGVNSLDCQLIGLSFCTKEGIAYYIPVGHHDAAQLDRALVLAQLKPILHNADHHQYLHNAKFDILVLSQYGITLGGQIFDTMIAASLLTKDWQRIGLKDLALHYFGEHMLTFDEVVKDRKLSNFAAVDLVLATDYAANDSLQTLRLAQRYIPELKEQRLDRLFYDLEMPVCLILCAMEREGISLDVDQLHHLDQHVMHDLEAIYAHILSQLPHSYHAINLNSPRQVEELLFTYLQLPPQKKSAKRTGYSTDQEVLQALSSLHPVPGLILKYRELYKLKSTYIDALPTYVNKRTHKVHTTFSQTRVPTGRLSSADPNLQNIPVGSGYGLEIRAAFKPQEGHLFLSADYSQIELRVLAHLSGDAALNAAFLLGHDIHAQTAAGLFGIPLDQVSHDQRQIGKRINFSILYGLTPYGLSKDLGISFKDARIYIERYFAQYPGVQGWMDSVINKAKEDGYVTTLGGRKRYIPGLNERNRVLYDEACRMAINTVAQGTAAEIMKKGMVAVAKECAARHDASRIVLQIHDELLICAPEQSMESLQEQVKKTLQQVVDWAVPLVVTTRTGSDWKQVSK